MDYLYTAPAGAPDQAFKDALHILSTPSGHKLPPNPLGLSEETLRSIRQWNSTKGNRDDSAL